MSGHNTQSVRRTISTPRQAKTLNPTSQCLLYDIGGEFVAHKNRQILVQTVMRPTHPVRTRYVRSTRDQVSHAGSSCNDDLIPEVCVCYVFFLFQF